MPFLYQKKSLGDAKTLLKWLVEQRNSAAIEHVTDAMLEDVIESHEYVAVLFTGEGPFINYVTQTGEPQFNYNKPGPSHRAIIITLREHFLFLLKSFKC